MYIHILRQTIHFSVILAFKELDWGKFAQKPQLL